MIENLEQRMDRIEKTLDTIATNHLTHIERYTFWTLIGIVCSVSIGIFAVYLGLK